jgi:hypothetical protein
VLFVLFFVVESRLPDEFVITPFGPRLKQCVLGLPSGSFVSDKKAPFGKLYVEVPTENGAFEQRFMDVPPECGDDMAQVKERVSKRQTVGQYNGWLEYASFFPDGGVSSFNGTCTVPNDPRVTSPQTLFYFIGTQDDDDSAVNILQPVLTWGNGYEEWYAASWACCPSNITVHSDFLMGFKAGDSMGGIIHRDTPSTWTIVSSLGSQTTTLRTQVGDYNYNWVDVTLEVYNVDTCDQFASGASTFSGLAIDDDNYRPITSFPWQNSVNSACGGSVVERSSTEIAIQLTQA